MAGDQQPDTVDDQQTADDHLDDLDPAFDLEDDEFVEINLRQPADAAGKLLVLVAVARRGYLEQRQQAVDDEDDSGDDQEPIDAGAAETERFDLNHWLAEEKLTAWADSFEQSVLRTPIGGLDHQDAIDATWAIEAAAALAWALGKLPHVPRFDTPVDAAAVIDAIPVPWSRTTEFRNEATLRGEEDIAKVREQAELWADRADTQRWLQAGDMLDEADGPGDPSILGDLESAVADTAAAARAAGLLPPLQEGDFPTRFGPYRTLGHDEVDELEALANQRLHALNWLCGLVDE